MLTYSLEERDGLPLYEYLYRRIRQDILEGTLAAGERLPSKRALAEHLRISVVTVENAYQQLEAEGFLLSRPRRGFFAAPVERLPAAPAARPPAEEAEEPAWRLDLKSGQVDAARFPVSVWARLIRQVLSEGGEALLTPVHRQGLPALRRAIAGDLRDRKGMAVAPRSTSISCWPSCWRGRLSPWRTRAIPRSGRSMPSAARPAARCPWMDRGWIWRPWPPPGPGRSISPPHTTTPPGW